MEPFTMLDSRKRELLRTLLNEDDPISYKELSERFKLSTRTIQREVKSLTSFLQKFDLVIERKIGAGITLKGLDEDKQQLKKQLGQARIQHAYTPEERQEGIMYDLLLAKEPIKQYVFSRKYGVSEATISYDLDKVNQWLEEGEASLIRSPGIGIYIDGTEQQRRTLLSRLLHKDITFEEWLELFHVKKEEDSLQGKLGVLIRNRLLKFVQIDKILEVDKALHNILYHQPDVVLTDRNYVNLIVHIMLALERIQSGEVIEGENLTDTKLFEPEVYALAEKIVKRLEEVTSLSIPKIEVNYIALHLAGTRISNGRNTQEQDQEEFTLVEWTQSFIRAIEFYLEESFEEDQLLFDGLVSHFAPALNRLKYGLQIHNPMLDKIKEKYPEILAACEKACEFLSKKTGFTIPEAEIGYLAMHIGASQLRRKERMKREFTAIVVCASGVGTSTYLATRIFAEIPSLHVDAIVSVKELGEWLTEERHVDIVISTVNLPFEINQQVVVVSPFLKQEDLVLIQESLMKPKVQQPVVKQHKKSAPSANAMLSLATYGEGMVQILRNVRLYTDVNAAYPMIPHLLHLMKNTETIGDIDQVIHDLQLREQQGGFVLGDLAMIHTKSEGAKGLQVAIFRMKDAVHWEGDDGEAHVVRTILLLALPKHAPKEHAELISEITAMFVDETFVHALVTAPFDAVKASLEDVLVEAFERRVTTSVRELQIR